MDDSAPPMRPLAALERLAARLPPEDALDGRGQALLGRVAGRIARDLLPRLRGTRPDWIVGVVGPNNAGKSSLVNFLAGQVVSAVRATGGATRRLVGVAGPRTHGHWVGQRAPLGVARGQALGPFVTVDFDPAGGGDGIALEASHDPAELCLAKAGAMPEGVLLVDSPDFDSARAGHREASEALALVADLALVVVTKGSYLNAEVVDYLRSWLEGGRPYGVVLNQSAGLRAAEAQVGELARQVGAQPVAAFHAPLVPDVQRTGRFPEPEGLFGGPTLMEWWRDSAVREPLRRAAMAASVRALDRELGELRDHLRARGESARALLDRAAEHAREGALRTTRGLLPSAPLAAAFRAVLDQRGGAWHRGVRGGARWLGAQVAKLPKLLGNREIPAEAPSDLGQVERARLESQWFSWFEPMARDLGPSPRDPAAARAPEDLAAALASDLSRPGWEVREAAVAALAEHPPEFDTFESACRQLVEEEYERQGSAWLLQGAATALALAPVGVGAAVIATTGGLGADLAVAGASAASYSAYTWALERIGKPWMERARSAWEVPRGAAVQGMLLRAALPTALSRLDAALAASSALDALVWPEEDRP